MKKETETPLDNLINETIKEFKDKFTEDDLFDEDKEEERSFLVSGLVANLIQECIDEAPCRSIENHTKTVEEKPLSVKETDDSIIAWGVRLDHKLGKGGLHTAYLKREIKERAIQAKVSREFAILKGKILTLIETQLEGTRCKATKDVASSFLQESKVNLLFI